MLLGENKEISSTTHQKSLQKKKVTTPKSEFPNRTCQVATERGSQRTTANYSEEVDSFPRTHFA